MDRVQQQVLVNAVKHLRGSYNAADFLGRCDTCSAVSKTGKIRVNSNDITQTVIPLLLVKR
jgi:hypothetical protein